MTFSFFPWKEEDVDFRKVEELFALKNYENSLIFNFGAEFYEESINDKTNSEIGLVFNGGKFPDAIMYNGSTRETVRIEFEYNSSSFRSHNHDPRDCDLIVCAVDDWEDVYPNEMRPLPVYVVGSKNLKR